MNYDNFVLPFVFGLIILFGVLIYKYIRWLKKLTSVEWKRIISNLFTRRLFRAIKEIFLECLLHRKIFKQNFFLGYMHACFALGWLLLIVAGTLESKFHTGGQFKPPYFPIFYKFFVHNDIETRYASVFLFIMDFLLLLILSGLLLAVLKRLNSKAFGMKKTTKFGFGNKLAVTSLWLIFPLRLLAESYTSAIYNNGDFLTATLGKIIAHTNTVQYLEYPLWWAYSITLGVFFVSIPFSRYMHIPTEVLLIFLRNMGIDNSRKYEGFSMIELNSCPRCGLCIDVCQLNNIFNLRNITPSYYLKSIRDKKVEESVTYNCLMCGRCAEFCPVGIDTLTQRILQRNKFISYYNELSNYQIIKSSNCSDVAYFAGCITHLTPGIKKSVINILKAANINFTFIDAEAGLCCGRPQMLAGNLELMDKLIENNKKIIYETKAKTLLTSCPICYKIFKYHYNLNIEVVHHSQYFNNLINQGLLQLKSLDSKVVYHDPCELVRNNGSNLNGWRSLVANAKSEPRNLLSKISVLQNPQYSRDNSFCCGGSLGELELSNNKKRQISSNTISLLAENKPDMIITSCPLCKKTLNQYQDYSILDISEILNQAIVNN